MAAPVLLFASFAVTMLLLGVALAIAWAKLGREQHAALWACGFLAVVGTYVVVPMAFAWPRWHVLFIGIADTFGQLCALLIAFGFRYRSGLKRRLPVLVAWIGSALLLSAVYRPGTALDWLRIVPTGNSVVLYLMSALALRSGPRRADAATRANLAMLLAFAVFQAVCTVLANGFGPGSLDPLALYNATALLGVPIGMTGLGLFMLLLIASDLADRLRCLAASDPLTGVLNRRGVEAAAERMLADCRRGGRPMTLILADLDRFKSINDRFGHTLGDAVLRCFAQHCDATVRRGDAVGRLGGEEFILLMPGTSPRTATEAMQRLRAGLSGALAACGLPTAVTASFGIASVDGRDDTLAEMIERADAALFGSKEDGRDRISLAPTDRAAEARFAKAFSRAS